METEAQKQARIARQNSVSGGKSIVTPYMKEYTDPVHPLMKKLIALEDRIAKYKRVMGSMSIDDPNAINEVDWSTLNDDLKFVTDTRRECSMDVNKILSDSSLIDFNRMWKKYKIKE